MGRIDPVEYVGVSQQRNGDVRNINHPLCGCAVIVIQKTRIGGTQIAFKAECIKFDFVKIRIRGLKILLTAGKILKEWSCRKHIRQTARYKY